MDGGEARGPEDHNFAPVLQITPMLKHNVDSLPDSVGTPGKLPLDDDPDWKPKKKTVVEMLLEESFCLRGFTKDSLLKFVLTSQILESDRQKYLSGQMPKSQLGMHYRFGSKLSSLS